MLHEVPIIDCVGTCLAGKTFHIFRLPEPFSEHHGDTSKTKRVHANDGSSLFTVPGDGKEGFQRIDSS